MSEHARKFEAKLKKAEADAQLFNDREGLFNLLEEAAADDSTASEADEAPAAAPPKARRRVIEGDY